MAAQGAVEPAESETLPPAPEYRRLVIPVVMALPPPTILEAEAEAQERQVKMPLRVMPATEATVLQTPSLAHLSREREAAGEQAQTLTALEDRVVLPQEETPQAPMQRLTLAQDQAVSNPPTMSPLEMVVQVL